MVKGLYLDQESYRAQVGCACLSHLQDGDPLTDRKSELSVMTHIKWFARCLSLARGLIKIIYYFYDLVKLVRKHAPTRMARESWLRTSYYKGPAPYLQKRAAPPPNANLLFRTQG